MSLRLRFVVAWVAWLVASAGGSARVDAAENLLRNGSFEGALLYWHNTNPATHKIVAEGKNGPQALRVEKGNVMSAPFVAKAGESFTVSAWVKGDKNGTIHAQMPPSAREVGTASKRLWMRESAQSAPIGPEWKRVSFTWKADVKNDGFWPQQHYLVLFESHGSTPFLLDGVTVVAGSEGTPDYVPRRELEVLAECRDWPGFEGAKANLFEPGQTVRLVAHASNPGATERKAVVRWQFFDYEGQDALAPPVDKSIKLAPGATEAVEAALKLPANGCVIARASVLVDGKPIDSSELPLTSLPYPKAATKPDQRERFGGSFAGGLGCVQKFQKIGFGWVRWRPHCNGEDHLPVEPKPGEPWKWTWFDKELQEQEAHGCSSHLVLYPPPKWIMEPGHPLPKDMRWPADDPKWDDLTVETVWDKFVREAVKRYAKYSVIFEIENEPEFDRWTDRDLRKEYLKFTTRTARLIKQTAPGAKVMVNNVYGIPSDVNSLLLRTPGALKDVDVISWHDYHAGWLTDHKGIRRMRQNLDEAGAKHVEVWFNEGWAFTNTAVDEPIACTHLNSAQSTNAIMASTAEMTIAGQEKTVLFHTTYETHGQSFWDYSGPGTMLWDWYNYPLPLVASWNVMAHHIGVSDEAGFVRPLGGNFAIFQDLRNERGVIVAYADQGAKQDVVIDLPKSLHGLTAEDAMGNPVALVEGKLTLRKSGRLVYLYDAKKTPAAEFVAALEPLDRKHAGFVSTQPGAAPTWRLPPTWDGEKKGESDGSVALADGKPIWKLLQVWPADPRKPENYRPMIWTGTEWNVKEGGFGGQPGASLKDGVLSFGTRAEHGEPRARRFAALAFVAPQTARYTLNVTASSRIWDGQNTTQLVFYRKTAGAVEKLNAKAVKHQETVPIQNFVFDLAEGDEFLILPQIEGAFAGGSTNLADLSITLGGANAAAAGYRLPAVWEGQKKGAADNNPLVAGGKPIWRLDFLKPKADRILPASYEPLVWEGTEWIAREGGQGGQPEVDVSDGICKIGFRGPWSGPDVEYEKTAGLVFVAPAAGVYRVAATVNARKWEGGAKDFPFVVLKKDAQRVAEVKRLTLSSDGAPQEIALEVELSDGHELVLMPLCPHYHTGASCTIDGLVITPAE